MVAEYCINAIYIAGTIVACSLALVCAIGLLALAKGIKEVFL